MEKNIRIGLFTVLGFFVVSLVLLLVAMEASGDTFTPFALFATVLFVLSFLGVLGFSVWTIVHRREKNREICALYGKEGLEKRSFTAFVNVMIHGAIRHPVQSNIVFDKDGMFLAANKIKVAWENVEQVTFKDYSIYIKVRDFAQFESDDFCGLVLPFKDYLYYLVKTFYKGEVVGDDYAHNLLTGFKDKPDVLYRHSNVLRLSLIVSTACFLAVAVGTGIGLSLALGAGMGDVATLIAVPCVVAPLVFFLQRSNLRTWAKLTITERGVEISLRDNSNNVSIKQTYSIEWDELKLIKFNDRNIKFEGNPSIVYVNSPKIHDKVKEIVDKYAPDTSWVPTSEVLDFKRLVRNSLKKSLFFDVAFEKNTTLTA